MLILGLDVETIFDKAIETKFMYKSDIIKFLKTHERKQVVVENIKQQIREIEWTNPKLLDGKKRSRFIEDMAIMFANAALEHKRQEFLTQGERNRMIREGDRIERAQDMMDQLEKEAKSTDIKSYMIDAHGGHYNITQGADDGQDGTTS